jgi:uncharacterized membrane protein YbaN (DUF454 family)
MNWHLLLNIVGVVITLFVMTPFIAVPLLAYHRARFKNELELIAEFNPQLEQDDIEAAWLRTFGGDTE